MRGGSNIRREVKGCAIFLTDKNQIRNNALPALPEYERPEVLLPML